MFTSSNALLWRGLLAVVIGILSVTWPGITIGAFVVVFAVYAFMSAVTDGARAVAADRVGPVLGWLLLALLSAHDLGRRVGADDRWHGDRPVLPAR
jgi:uncharacterized membrane protein HdeD (DUF308 family)